jgi:hypothetical protein
MSNLRVLALLFAILTSALLFTVLIAHCLAWFIVYKAEARLGELRAGILRGGEMRVCLCTRYLRHESNAIIQALLYVSTGQRVQSMNVSLGYTP